MERIITSTIGTIARLGNGNGNGTGTDTKQGLEAGRERAKTYRQCLIKSGGIIWVNSSLGYGCGWLYVLLVCNSLLASNQTFIGIIIVIVGYGISVNDHRVA